MLVDHGHDRFERLRRIVGLANHLVTLHDSLDHDLVWEANLALIEERDLVYAIRAYGARERSLRPAYPLLFEAA